MLETQDRWFGVTYKEDKEIVQKAFRRVDSEWNLCGKTFGSDEIIKTQLKIPETLRNQYTK